jgi:membrane-associated phospholipid phosphatase
MIKQLLTLLLVLIPVSLFPQNIDIRLLNVINSSQTQSTDNFFKFVSNTNDMVVAGIPVSMGIAGLVKHDGLLFRNACVILAADIVNVGVTYTLKHAINRKRPFETYSFIAKKIEADGGSFPSGHASSAFATATSLSLTYPKWYVIVPSYVWAGTVSYSRLQLGVHYPGDVLGGMIIGAGSAYLTYKLNKWLNKHNAKKHEPR